jgi:hypothetical protein
MSQPVDGKTYYGYLFETDKKPTKVLDALLRGIANYIVSFECAVYAAPATEQFWELTVHRVTSLGIRTRNVSPLQSWQASTRLWEETTTVSYLLSPLIVGSRLT